MSTVERDGIKDSRYLPRTPLPEVKLAPSERFLRLLGLLPVKTIIAGNTQNIADRVYKARGPAAMEAHHVTTNAYYDELARQGTGNPILSVIQEKGTAIQQEGTAIQQEGQTVGAPAARITAADIYRGYHQPSKPEEIIWGGRIFLSLPIQQRETISRLCNIIHSGDSSVVNVNDYKIILDNLISRNDRTYTTLDTLVSNKSMLFNPDLIKGYWNRYYRFDYSIEPDEIYFFIFDWISKNTIFTEEPYIIFPSAISHFIRKILEESRISPPKDDTYPFNQRKREFIRRLYYSPRGEPQLILNELMTVEEQDIFKPRLMGELDFRETSINRIYEFANGNFARRIYPDIVLEDCKLLWYQLTRITQRMRKLYPIYREEEVYAANQSRSIIDFFLQNKLFSEFDKKNSKMTKQARRRSYCINSRLFYENSGQGNCGLDVIAQIYEPYDYDTERDNFLQFTAPISIRLRELLTRAYAKAQNEEGFRIIVGNGFRRNGVIQDGRRVRTYGEYSQHISYDGTWLGDNDIQILMWLLGKLPYKYIAPSIENQQAISIEFGKNRTDYTICNIGGMHWRLKRGGEPRIWDNDLLHAERILRLSARDIILEQELPPLPLSPDVAEQQESPQLPLSPEASAAESAIAASGILGIERQASAVASVIAAPAVASVAPVIAAPAVASVIAAPAVASVAPVIAAPAVASVIAAPEEEFELEEEAGVAPTVAEEGSTQMEFDFLTQQMKKLAITYRTAEFECFTVIEYLHKNHAKSSENKLQGGGKTRKNKRKQ